MAPVLVANAVTLPDSFDIPCIGGAGIIADICEAVNLLNNEQVAQKIRITDNEDNIADHEIRITDNEIDIISLFTVQNLEQLEQDIIQIDVSKISLDIVTIQSDVSTLQTDVDTLEGFHVLELPLPAQFLIKTILDIHPPICGDISENFHEAWCPGGNARNFAISDVDVTANSMVSVAIIGLPVDVRGCAVTDIVDGEFQVRCFGTFTGNSLRYIVVN